MFGVALMAGVPGVDPIITTKNEMTTASTASDLKPTRTGALFIVIDGPLSLASGPIAEATPIERNLTLRVL